MSIFSEIITAAAAFTVTNLDDIVLLTLFFSLMQERKQKKYIVVGEYLGIITLILLSLVSARGAAAVLGRYIWLVGILPIIFGIKEAIKLFKISDDAEESAYVISGTWILVYKEWAVTVANGSDNVSVYLPLLAERHGAELLIFFATMMAMTTLWWCLASAIVSLPKVGEGISRASRYLLPTAFIFVGASTVLRGLGLI